MDQGFGTAWSTRKDANEASQMLGSSHGARVPCLLCDRAHANVIKHIAMDAYRDGILAVTISWISQTCESLMYLDIGEAPRYLRRMKNLVDSFLS